MHGVGSLGFNPKPYKPFRDEAKPETLNPKPV